MIIGRRKGRGNTFSLQVMECCVGILFLCTSGIVAAAVDDVTHIVITSAVGGTSPLQISEIVAFDANTSQDVALGSAGASASATGIWNDDIESYGPQLAIDGEAMPGKDSSKNYYHSDNAPAAALTITLAQPTTIGRIDIVGRGDCCLERDRYNIELLNASATRLDFRQDIEVDYTRRGTAQFAVLAGVEEVGEWGEVKDWPLVSVSMASLPDGRILSYSGSERRTWPSTEQTYSAVWDPQTDTFTERLHVGHNMFCGTLAMIDDGRVFVNGGRNASNSPWVSTFDYRSDTWNQLDNMASGGRWYPTTLALGDGSVLTAMGSSTNTSNPDLWNAQDGSRVLNGIDFLGLRSRRDRQTWFPLLSLAPNGDIFHFWDPVESHFISSTGNGSTTPANANYDSTEHFGGIQVMYDEGELMISGSNDGSWFTNDVSRNAFTVDLNSATPSIQSIEPMIYPRKFHQLITLPTGEVMAIGGNTTGAKFRDFGSVLEPEVWNPQTGQWRLMAPMAVARDYHSTAMLMTDGRVIAAGGGYSSGNANSPGTHQDAEIYSPPYLFNDSGQLAVRPVINVALTELSYGDSVLVTGSSNIAEFSMIRMSATTHAVNTDQRFYRPAFTSLGNGSYQVTMHSNPNVATPGYWMLFAIDDEGVPSEAQVVRISSDVPDNPNNGQAAEITPIIATPQQTGDSTSFSVSAIGTGLSYSWNFGDGSGDSIFTASPNTTHTYSEPGRYVVTVTVRTANGIDSISSFTQMVFAPVTTASPMHSNGVMHLATENEVWVVNPDNDSVAIVDTVTRSRTGLVQVGNNPRAIAAAPDGKVWVINKDSANISIIDPVNRSVSQTLPLDVASRPHGLVFNTHSAYIALEALGEVIQISLSTQAETGRQTAGLRPRHLSIDAGGSTIYVSNYITPKLPGEDSVTVLPGNQGGQIYRFTSSVSQLTPQGTITLGHSNRVVSENQGPGIPNYLGPLVISPDGSHAWLPSKQDNVLAGSLRGGPGITFDQTVRAITSKIDLQSQTESINSRVDHDNSSVVSHAAFDSQGLVLFTSLEGNRQIALINPQDDLEYARFDTGRTPQSLVVSDDGTQLFVHNFLDRTLGIYDVENAIKRGSSQVTEIATVGLVSSEALSPTILAGKQLFYDSRDDRLAALDYMSCAACHNDGEHDGRTWDFTSLGEGLRNTTSLRGMGELTGRLHWSANFDEVQDFEIQLRNFNGGEGLMSDADFLTGTTSNPLGSPKAGLSDDLDALAAYVESLTVAIPSPHRSASGALTTAAQTGRQLFAANGCASCHSGATFTDSESAAMHDIGTIDIASGTRMGGELDGLDTPSLLGAWSSAPFLHDGAADTLQAAISAHADINLATAELDNLAAFVSQIDSSEPEVVPAPPPNPEPPVPEGPFGAFANVELDGQVDDWPLEALVAIDPKDATGGNNRLDYMRAWVAHDINNLYFRYDNHAPNNTELTWGYSIGIDVDGSVNGYTAGFLPIGIDYLIESREVYRYTGNGTSWSWQWLMQAPAALNGQTTELGLPRSVVGNPQQFDFIFSADNAAIGGSAIDFVPDTVTDQDAAFDTRFLTYEFDATVTPPNPTPAPAPTIYFNAALSVTIDGNLSDWNVFQSFEADADDVTATTDVVDYLQAWAAHDSDNFYFAWNNDGPTSITWGNALFIDSDLSLQSGFRGFANDAPIGIDYLLEGNSVFRYNGTGNNWSWEYLGNSTVALGPDSVEIAVPANMIGNPQTIDLFFRGDSTALGGSAIDFYPDSASQPLDSITSRRFRYTRDVSQRSGDRSSETTAQWVPTGARR